ncbi:MAG: glycosyltransferase family 9 protein [Candidatus Omnitrophota bacterium]
MKTPATEAEAQIKKIVVIRTDRIGEVVLTTPVITAMREAYPGAHISMVVRPRVRPLVEDNPYIDEVIEYAPPAAGLREAFWLRAALIGRAFDIAIVVNPRKESHLAVFLAGIPVRVGFDHKWAFLLTHKVKDLKALAARHEVEYNLDLPRAIGIEPRKKYPFIDVTVPLEKITQKIKEASPTGSDICCLAAIHPCTSDPRKQWPLESFARAADMLVDKGYAVVVIAGVEEAPAARKMIALMKRAPVDLSGKLDLKELAALLESSKFLISADSGPVHIAAAVGTPVVALFGGASEGSKPKRWGPFGHGHIVIQKQNINDITPEEVVAAVRSIKTSENEHVHAK